MICPLLYGKGREHVIISVTQVMQGTGILLKDLITVPKGSSATILSVAVIPCLLVDLQSV